MINSLARQVARHKEEAQRHLELAQELEAERVGLEEVLSEWQEGVQALEDSNLISDSQN